MSDGRWCIETSRLVDSPSRRHGITEEKEQAYLQQTANFIQEMGRKLALPLLCINTAVLFTQRFYVFHPLTVFERYSLGASALFLAAKVEEHPRKAEHLCQIARMMGLLKKEVKDKDYIQDLLFNENMILQTLGFELQVQHPHQFILSLCELFHVSKTLSQTAYILATYCLHLTKMCLMYKPTLIACLCIHMACKMTGWAIPDSREGKQWYLYGDASVTEERLESLCDEFLSVLSKCPEKIKNKTLLANHENLVKKLAVDATGLPVVKDSASAQPNKTERDAKITPQSSHESSSQKLVRSLHDGIRNFASTFSSQSSNKSSCDPMEWTLDDSSRDFRDGPQPESEPPKVLKLSSVAQNHSMDSSSKDCFDEFKPESVQLKALRPSTIHQSISVDNSVRDFLDGSQSESAPPKVLKLATITQSHSMENSSRDFLDGSQRGSAPPKVPKLSIVTQSHSVDNSSRNFLAGSLLETVSHKVLKPSTATKSQFVDSSSRNVRDGFRPDSALHKAPKLPTVTKNHSSGVSSRSHPVSLQPKVQELSFGTKSHSFEEGSYRIKVKSSQSLLDPTKIVIHSSSALSQPVTKTESSNPTFDYNKNKWVKDLNQSKASSHASSLALEKNAFSDIQHSGRQHRNYHSTGPQRSGRKPEDDPHQKKSYSFQEFIHQQKMAATLPLPSRSTNSRSLLLPQTVAHDRTKVQQADRNRSQAPTLPSVSSGSLKISIPRNRISGFQPLVPPHRPATPADVKTDTSKMNRIPTTASMGSETARSEAKRFRPN